MEYGCKYKVVVITGGTSGIGLAAARAFWLDGASVSIVGRDSIRGMKALTEIAGCKNPEAAVFPGLLDGETTISAADGLSASDDPDRVITGTAEELTRLRYIRADVTKPGECRMAAAIAAYYGADRIDILVNSAGIYQEKRIENVTVADYNRTMDVNLKGTLFMIQACQPYLLLHRENEKGAATADGGVSAEPGRGDKGCLTAMRDRCIINIASDAGLGGNYGCPLYCASKGAVVSLTKALALDLAPDIRVNCICPGDVDTPLLAAQLVAAKGSYTKAEMGEGYPLGRIAKAEEVAHVICSVASPANAFMTGAVIPVDGGLTAMG
jgi:NAD(P)-dependent dehydrogenase (short-subunit alcohol dehydrogenase family)